MSAMGGGKDQGNLFPASDADDLARGARFIPGEVTLARRDGQKVAFVQRCGKCCWFWEMPDGTRIYHWDRDTYEWIAQDNGQKWEGEFHGKAGACPLCGNTHTNGETVKP